MTPTIENRIAQLELRINAACRAASRDRDEVTLVAVSKRKPTELIQQAYDLGLRDFGENYAQELRDKADRLADLKDVRWHFIGPLQRNKVQIVVGRCTLLHAIDSLPLAERIEHIASQRGIVQDITIQLNLAGEQTKSGITTEELDSLRSRIAELNHVRCVGLMTMPPPFEDPTATAPFFRQLRQVRDARGDEGLTALSMGMSHDFETAIAEGATLIRVGSQIFGPRPPRP